jgi:hypothetical protein
MTSLPEVLLPRQRQLSAWMAGMESGASARGGAVYAAIKAEQPP